MTSTYTYYILYKYHERSNGPVKDMEKRFILGTVIVIFMFNKYLVLINISIFDLLSL